MTHRDIKKISMNLEKKTKILKEKYDEPETIKSNGKNSVNSAIRGSRITVRTPPVDGKIGRVPTISPSPRRTTPSINEAITAKIQESIIQKEPEVGQQDQKDSLLSRFKRNLTLQSSAKQSNLMPFLV
ncbi:hypothetical protein MXB_1459, partial [Myxobolus squamalis]